MIKTNTLISASGFNIIHGIDAIKLDDAKMYVELNETKEMVDILDYLKLDYKMDDLERAFQRNFSEGIFLELTIEEASLNC